MIDLVFPGYPVLYRWWSDALTRAVRGQWELVEAQYRFGIRVLDTLREMSAGQGPAADWTREVAMPDTTTKTKSLEQQAVERLRQGLAPPREIYEVQNRNRLDWSSVPDWARPSEPDLFEGAHEG
jgi:hypothetical protein